jgi:hypothetical protein
MPTVSHVAVILIVALLAGGVRVVSEIQQAMKTNRARVPLHAVRFALFDRKTGFQPVREDSASRLSANEPTGWKPVGQDRQDACPPAKPPVLGVPLAETLPQDAEGGTLEACAPRFVRQALT